MKIFINCPRLSSYKSPQSGVFGVIGVYIWNHPILGCLRCTEVYEVQWGAWWEIVRDGNWGALRCMRCNPHINHPKVGCLGWLGCIYEITPFWGVPYSLLLTPYSLLLTPYSLLLTPCSLLLTPCSLLLTPALTWYNPRNRGTSS